MSRSAKAQDGFPVLAAQGQTQRGIDSSIEIRHLRYFLSVAETNNFTRAAERMGISQPSISQQIKELEDRLGTPLFARLGRRVRLTEAGEAFKLQAEVILLKLDEARDSVRRIGDLLSGRVEVGVIPAVQFAWIPPVLQRIARDHPGITVAVHELPSRVIETEVEAGRLDLGLGVLAHNPPGLTYQHLISQHLALIVPEDHGYTAVKQLPLAELKDVPLILFPASFDMRQLAEALFRYSSLRPRLAFEIGTIDAALQTAKLTSIPALLPPIVLEGRESLGLRAVPIVSDAPPLDFGIQWPRGSDPTPAASLFAETLLAIAAPGRSRTEPTGVRRSPPSPRRRAR
jgi:LysR family cyn operon transcriptional activator